MVGGAGLIDNLLLARRRRLLEGVISRVALATGRINGCCCAGNEVWDGSFNYHGCDSPAVVLGLPTHSAMSSASAPGNFDGKFRLWASCRMAFLGARQGYTAPWRRLPKLDVL